MMKGKQFYINLSIFVVIFIIAVSIFNHKDEEITGDKLIYRNNMIYTLDEQKYSGKITESLGLKAKINGEQIANGYIKVKNGLLNGKFSFTSSGGVWSGEIVKGNAKNGKINKIEVIAKGGKPIKLSGKDKIEKFFWEKFKNLENPESSLLSALGVGEENR